MAVRDAMSSFDETSELAHEYAEYTWAQRARVRHCRWWRDRAHNLCVQLEDLLEADVSSLLRDDPLLQELRELCRASGRTFRPLLFREVKQALDAVLDDEGVLSFFQRELAAALYEERQRSRGALLGSEVASDDAEEEVP